MSSSRLHHLPASSQRERITFRGSTTTLALALAALALTPAGALAQTPAPLAGGGQAGAIADRYIVVMKSAAGDAATERTKNKARARGGSVNRDYRQALNGYAALLPAAALAEVRSDPDVAYVEADRVVSATATQASAPWGLDRIDQRGLPLSGSYSYTPTATGVKVYIIDSGIRFSHGQFAGRAVSGYDAIDGGSADDCNGHGTHVAGSVGAATYGVAKQVSLVGVRVLDCAGSGSTSGVIAGIDWVTANHGPGQPAVANMSLGGGASSALDTAVQNSISDGVSYAVAAGNENADACLSSPARAANALTVASTTSSDARSSFSNWGTCVDLFAPGSSIVSSWYTSDTATATLSGTSMATPHVAGVAALYLQGNPTASPATVASVVKDGATTGKVTSAATGSPNRLLYSLLGAVPAPTGCGLAQSYSGSLSGTGASAIQPNGTYYRSTTSGTHRGCLRGPSTANFDLHLDKYVSSRWTQVAKAAGSTSNEDIAYSGTSGYYRWRVVSSSGSGSYTFELTKPS
ncbi:MAG: S8 family peptidase [Actinomycetota bacterium]|nr:S8 family peptidase [Actinomycetota bacterium]